MTLSERLRAGHGPADPLCEEAADTIDALVQERDAARVVTDEMVERAARALMPGSMGWDRSSEYVRAAYRDNARAALTAALQPAPRNPEAG